METLQYPIDNDLPLSDQGHVTTAQNQNQASGSLETTGSLSRPSALRGKSSIPYITTATNVLHPPRLTQKFFELCINTDEYDITLVEIEISTSRSSITSDSQLFQEIRKKYNHHWNFLRTHSLSLFKPIDVHYVQVSASLNLWSLTPIN